MNEAASARRPIRLAAAPVLSGRYLSITSYRRDGRGVASPVWFVQRDGRLPGGDRRRLRQGRKRIRRNPQVRVAASRRSGRTARRAGARGRRCFPAPDRRGQQLVARVPVRPGRVRPLRFVQARVHPGRPRTGRRSAGHHAQLDGLPRRPRRSEAMPGRRPRSPASWRKTRVSLRWCRSSGSGCLCARYRPPEDLRAGGASPARSRRDGGTRRVRATAVTSSDCLVRSLDVPPGCGSRRGWPWA